jgi:hypothetical protein
MLGRSRAFFVQRNNSNVVLVAFGLVRPNITRGAKLWRLPQGLLQSIDFSDTSLYRLEINFQIDETMQLDERIAQCRKVAEQRRWR